MAIDLTKRPLQESDDSSSKQGKELSLDKTPPPPVTPPTPAPSQDQPEAIEDLSTWQYYLKAFQLFGNARGRARRKEYWGFALWSGVMSLAMMAVDVALGFDGEFSPVYSLYALAAFIPGITVWIRRMHDVGRSGWWFLIYFTGIGILFLIYWLFKDSEPGPNKWGPNPKGL